MNKASKPVKRANLNTSAPTREKALNVGTGNEGGRAAVTATIPSAQIAYQIYRLTVNCCRLHPENIAFRHPGMMAVVARTPHARRRRARALTAKGPTSRGRYLSLPIARSFASILPLDPVFGSALDMSRILSIFSATISIVTGWSGSN